jgi:phage terminase small subunit
LLEKQKKPMKKTLTVKQKAFVRAYKLNGGNATKAAIKAGYSKKTAYSMGQQNLKKLEIKAALAKREVELEKKYEVTEAQIINELKLLGFSDLQNYITIDNDTGAVQAKGF